MTGRRIFLVFLAVWFAAFAGIAMAKADGPFLTVDGVTYAPSQVSGPVRHYNTPDINPSAAFSDRHTWTGHGSENLPCYGGIHWIDNDNVLTVSHCLESTTTTTTQPETTTTTAPSSTTTSTPSTTTSSPKSSTTTTAPTVTSVPSTTSTVPDDLCEGFTGYRDDEPDECRLDELPRTGANTLHLALIAGGLLTLGAIFVFSAKRPL